MNQEDIIFMIKNIDILEFSFTHPMKVIPKDTPFRFDTTVERKVNLKEKLIIITSSFNIFCDQTNSNISNAKISCVYYIENIHQFIDESEKFELPEHVNTMFISISISTCRGVLFTLLRGTPLHSVILPIINPKELIRTSQD